MAHLILSIDGGGIRGIIPAVVLVELEKILNAQGKTKPLHNYFDLIAGTSTGAIIAAGLTCPKPKTRNKPAATPAELLALYEKKGPSIFKQTLISNLRSGFGLGEERYDAGPLEMILQEMLGEDTAISQALTKVLITAYDIQNRCAVFLTNADKEHQNFRFWEAARGSSAAPTYFEPALVETLRKRKGNTAVMLALVDGGTFANDPALAAYVEGRKLSGWKDEDIVILSIGTGSQNRPIPYQRAKGWGAWGWIDPSNDTPLISVFMQGQSSTTSYQLNKLLNPQQTGFNQGATVVTAQNRATLRYFRIDAPLVGVSDALDDASPKHIADLKSFGQNLARNFKDTLEAVAERIV
jgi:uncharacterized protein